MTRFALGLVLVMVPATAVAQPAVSDASPVAELVDATIATTSEALARSGTGYFAVWTDRRTGTAIEVHGARVATDGTVVDATGILLAVGSHPDLSDDAGGTHLLVFVDEGVRALRVTTDGSVTDATPIVVAPDGRLPRVATDGTDFLVTWVEGAAGEEDVRAAVVAADGTVSTAFDVAASADADKNPRVAGAPGGYLIAWTLTIGSDEHVRATRLDSAGNVIDSPPLAIGDGIAVAVASDGTDYLVAWNDLGALTRRVSAAGALGASLTSSGPHVVDSASALAFDGTAYTLVFESYTLSSHAILARRIATDGSALGDETTLSSSDPSRTHAAGREGQTLVAHAFAGDGLFGRRLDGSLSALDASAFPISNAPGSQTRPAVAFDGSGYLVVWDDHGRGMRAIGLDASGAPVGSSVEVADLGAAARVAPIADGFAVAYRAPRTPSDGACSTVAHDCDLAVRRLGPDGSPLDASPTTIETMGATGGQIRFDLAARDGAAAVVHSYDNERPVGLRILAADGTTGSRVELPMLHCTTPLVTADADGFTCLCRDTAQRVSPTGELVGDAIEVSGLCPGTHVDLLYAAGRYALLCSREGPSGDQVYVSILDGGLAPVGDALRLLDGPSADAALGWDGTHFVVAMAPSDTESDQGLRAARVSANAAVVEPALTIGAPDDPDRAPGLGFDGAGRGVIVHERFDPGSRVPRTYARTWTAECAGEPDGTACDDGDPCTEGDACTGGACTGALVPSCEPPAPDRDAAVPPSRDGGGGGGDAGTAPDDSTRRDDGCGCSAAGARDRNDRAVLLALLLLVGWRARRARRLRS